ncbi:hypothetical protein [Streptomyces sp. 3211]|uniref:hypothetical protein n=1 Tax=Streptomyces sp. 3211 TaxID=1964449 RepID=UPI0009A4B443|nr:hypothetical protein [Streptomyces sp. 3211]
MRSLISVSARSATAFLAIGLAVATTAGCSASSATAQSLRSAPARAFNGADPATWTLPMEGYLPSDHEQRQMSQAVNMLIGDCMKSTGYGRWRAAPELPKAGPKTLTDWRYGIHDIDLAKRRGYKADAAEQAVYDAAVNAGAVDGTSAMSPDGKALQACRAEARTKLKGDVVAYSEEAQGLGNEAFVRSKEDPTVVAAFQAWSSCMKEQGYEYMQPLDASDDPRFSGPDVTPEEIAAATADIACRDRTQVAKVWWEAESKLQTTSLEKHAESLNKSRKDMDATVKAAADVLAGKQ